MKPKIRMKTLAFLAIVVMIGMQGIAQSKTQASQDDDAKTASLIGEIAIGVLFVAAVVLFLIFKAKHDKKEKEKQIKIMQKIAAAKKRNS